jgi:hydroxymethylbilane synthase
VVVPGKITLGSRGSDLALAQVRLVEQALRKAWPQLDVAIEVIRTSGDENAQDAGIADRKAGRKGLFTREIEKELLVRRVDVAVHSAKDLPSERLDRSEVRATLPRAAIADILITKAGGGLAALARGNLVATGSIRRQRQLGWIRPDLQVADLHGNVPTRLRKLRENENWSGIILARAGLERLGLQVEGEILSTDDFVPAGGQGVIALQARRDDARVQNLIDAIDDRATHVCLRAEREFLRLLNGDCDSPVGVQAKLEAGELRLRAQVFEAPTAAPRVGATAGPSDDPEAVAAKLMTQMYGG